MGREVVAKAQSKVRPCGFWQHIHLLWMLLSRGIPLRQASGALCPLSASQDSNFAFSQSSPWGNGDHADGGGRQETLRAVLASTSCLKL